MIMRRVAVGETRPVGHTNGSLQPVSPRRFLAPSTAESPLWRSKYHDAIRSPLGHSTIPGAWLCVSTGGKTCSASCTGSSAGAGEDASSTVSTSMFMMMRPLSLRRTTTLRRSSEVVRPRSRSPRAIPSRIAVPGRSRTWEAFTNLSSPASPAAGRGPETAAAGWELFLRRFTRQRVVDDAPRINGRGVGPTWVRRRTVASCRGPRARGYGNGRCSGRHKVRTSWRCPPSRPGSRGPCPWDP